MSKAVSRSFFVAQLKATRQDLADKGAHPEVLAYWDDCIKQASCPDRSSFQGVKLKGVVDETSPS